jgi:two-component system, sensor histidine kinase and response regulator
MIDTVLRNLVSNALKFTKPGGEIIISGNKNSKETIICIEDNGVGIPEEQIDKLFQIDNNFKTKGTNQESGTGLGLKLCNEFIELHKGRIWIESVKGKGSKFNFSIPAFADIN